MKYEWEREHGFFFERVERKEDGAFYNPAHYHDLFEIYYITRGTCHYFIDQRCYYLETGDLVFIPEGVIHNTVYQNLGHERLLINCQERFVPAAARPKWYLYRNRQITGRILEILSEIETEYKRADRFSADAISCLMRMLFYLVARHPNQYESGEEKSGTASLALAYLQEHFDQELSLSDLARVVLVSPEHLSRLFKRETGLSFREYRNLIRLQKSEQLLSSTDLSVAQVALRCGFSDSNYFSVKFKEIYGQSPKAFQKSHRE